MSSETFAHAPTSEPLSLRFYGARTAIKRFYKHLQYGQMCSALNSLSDTLLAEIGTTRAGIPDFAHKLIFHPDD